MSVLFSPLGGTDPIANLRDGAMLHICRHYKPDKIYLFLSNEIAAFHEKDNRYLYCLEKLSEHLNCQFEYECILEKDFTEVHVFDECMERLQKHLPKIVKKEKDKTIYVNISSGTPAMKSALLLQSILSNGRLVPIQVASPQRRMNRDIEDREHYDPKEQWEVNEDNEKTQVNRCCIAKGKQWLWEVQKENIVKHIEAFNYVAALQILEVSETEGKEEIRASLSAAACRLKLDIKNIKKEDPVLYERFIPVKSSDSINIIEYALALKIKKEKEEYADFIRAVSPLLFDLYERILEKECGINIDEYTEKSSNKMKTKISGSKKWNKESLKAGEEVFDLLNMAYKERGGFKLTKGTDITNAHLNRIIYYKTEDEALKKKIDQLSKVESRIRNLAAHQIISITDTLIEEIAGIRSEGIWDIIRWLLERCKISKKGRLSLWDSYQEMNRYLADKLR